MALGPRELIQIAAVAAIFGGATAALVTRCAPSEPEDEVTSIVTTTGATQPTSTVSPRPNAASAARPAPPAATATSEASALSEAELERARAFAALFQNPVEAPGAPAETGTGPAARDAGAVAVADAGGPTQEQGAADGREGSETRELTEERSGAGDAGAKWPDDLPPPYRGPSFSAGAGRFTTEPLPTWASSFRANPDAGAGTFMTEAPPWGASAFVPNPQAGAGRFTTERTTTGNRWADRLYLEPKETD